MISHVVASLADDSMPGKQQPDNSSRVLFLGNNNESTDQWVSLIATESDTINHGLIQDGAFIPDQPGFYHTTVVDIPWGDLLQLSTRFDRITMLDQPAHEWSHWKCLQATCKLMLTLEKMGLPTNFRDNQNCKKILYWIDVVYHKNPSFCIYPWINFSSNNNTIKLCSRDRGTVTTLDQMEDWSNDPGYNRVRKAMLAGQRLLDHCKTCYDYESQNMESYRQFESIDWLTQLDIETVEDLDKITRPRFYEVHTGNHCNIKCRGCTPKDSAPIARELKKFKIMPLGGAGFQPSKYPMDRIDIDNLDQRSQVYFQGGEPTIMQEVREFMRRCIQKKRTDFFLTMCTNGVKMSDEFLDLVSHFSNVNFSVSLDGYQRINDYWRWGSKWDTVIANAHRVVDLGYSLSINTVPGIYNATNLHLLLEFLDREFPLTAIYMQVNYFVSQSVLNHPLTDLVIDSMRRCQQTSIYHSNGKSCKTSIDSIHDHYASRPQCDLEQLQAFFDYNDQLDRVRGSRLVDYIPELEAARAFLQ